MTRHDEIGPPTAGLSLKTLLQTTKPAALRKIIGPAGLEMIEQLYSGVFSDDRIVDIAVRLIDPVDALRDPTKRRHILSILPLKKARELLRRFGIQPDRDVYAKLYHAASQRSAIAVLFSFFGVVRNDPMERSDSARAASVSGVYGLFDYQRTAGSRVAQALVVPPHKVILHMPTGSGKTRTAMHVVCRHFQGNEPTVVCWLAQNAELLDQAADAFEEAWRHLGNRKLDLIRFWGSSESHIRDAKDAFIVAGLGKLRAYDGRDPTTVLRLADRTSLVVIDEAHQAIAPTYAALLSALYTKRPGNALLGLTATPGRSWSDIDEDRKLSEYFEGEKVTLDIVGYDDPVAFLIQEGYLARPALRTLYSDAALEWSRQDALEVSRAIDVPLPVLERLGNDAFRNLRIISAVEDLIGRHSRVIVFAPSVSSARLLCAILSTRGIESSVVTAHTNAAERERIVRRFRSALDRPMVIVNFGVLTTGFDAPSTSAAVIARPTKSLVLYNQMIGRAMRGPRAGGNERAEIVTVVDPHLPGFGSIAEAFRNWEDVWNERR